MKKARDRLEVYEVMQEVLGNQKGHEEPPEIGPDGGVRVPRKPKPEKPSGGRALKHARSDYDSIIDTSGKIPEDEPVLVIRGQDLAAIPTALAWCDEAQRLGAAPELVETVRQHTQVIADWQQNRVAKVPDAPEGVLR